MPSLHPHTYTILAGYLKIHVAKMKDLDERQHLLRQRIAARRMPEPERMIEYAALQRWFNAQRNAQHEELEATVEVIVATGHAFWGEQ